MINISEAAAILFHVDPANERSDGQKSEARTILKFFGVVGQDAPSAGIRPCKVYDQAQVKRIAELRAQF